MTTALRSLVVATTALVLVAFSGCATTTLETAWKAPEVGSIKFTKILLIAIAPVDSLRRPAEDAMKAQITTVPAVASYEVLPAVADQVDPKKVAEVIKTDGFDGIVVMRLVSMEDELTYNAGGYMPTSYYSFSSYYSPGYALAPYYRGGYGAGYGAGYGYGGMPMTYEYVPPSITKDVLMNLETAIYDAKTGKLIWTGMTKTTNPSERNNTIPEVAAAVRAKLREQKLIQ